jgi:hypothetical protein
MAPPMSAISPDVLSAAIRELREYLTVKFSELDRRLIDIIVECHRLSEEVYGLRSSLVQPSPSSPVAEPGPEP